MVQFSQCVDCKNYLGKKENDIPHCKAFPDGISNDIYWNRISHEEHIEGDNGIKFEALYN